MVAENSRHAQLRSLSQARREVYAFLAAAFTRPPTAETLASLSDENFLGSAEQLFGDQTVAQLRRFAAEPGRAGDVEAETRQAFMDIFKVPGGKYITPYESVYRDTRGAGDRAVSGLLMGGCAVDVQRWYRLAALDIAETAADLPDHIGLELGYLAHLCAKEGEFAAAADDRLLTRDWEMERDFLAAHVVTWIADLRDRLYTKWPHPYYCAIADLAVEFTRRDLATLEALLGPSTGESSPHYDPIRR